MDYRLLYEKTQTCRYFVFFFLPSAVYIELVMSVACASSITTRQPDLHDIFTSMNIFIFRYKLRSRAINKQHLTFLTIFGGQPSLPFSLGWGGIYSFSLDISMRGGLKVEAGPGSHPLIPRRCFSDFRGCDYAAVRHMSLHAMTQCRT